jgi:hypothetical protein
MVDWIKKNINPIGLSKERRGAIFHAIARVFEQVKNDAQTAFKAHFPYTADELKLLEHGEALHIPHMKSDRPDEYRKRVSAASFFLSGAGERGYIRCGISQWRSITKRRD